MTKIQEAQKAYNEAICGSISRYSFAMSTGATVGHPTSGQPEKHTVHWFRKGLRLHDNPSLREGLRGAKTFRCVFILDPWFAGSSNVGINKWRFLLQCLEDLDRSLRKLNSRLFVIRGQPADALPKLFKEWGTTNLTFEEDPEPYGRVRDDNITALCRELGISVIQRGSHTLYHLQKIIERNGGRAPLTYHQFQAVIANMEAPPLAEPGITQHNMGKAHTPLHDDHDEKYGVPTLEELGFETEGLRPPVWQGGESEALTRLERHLERKAWVASFGRPKMTPQSLLASQTGLSPYLRFGCLSTRLFYYQLNDLYKKIKKARPPLSLHGQLLWREFFYCAATRNANFDKMIGNPICVQIPWDKNAEALAKWANGQTGFPWIDAIMTQLREEGWIHHLARHAVACFLTRGDLWLSWEEGMKVFEELLLDADWSVNAGVWMWLSCSSFFQQFFHCYCPVRFGRKADPNGDYIRRYVPILKNFPTKYIHEPWVAPDNVQQGAKCVIGKDYPLPMVNHTVASKVNVQRMRQVYQQLIKYRHTSDKGLIAPNAQNIVLMTTNQKTNDNSYNLHLNHGIIPSTTMYITTDQYQNVANYPNEAMAFIPTQQVYSEPMKQSPTSMNYMMTNQEISCYEITDSSANYSEPMKASPISTNYVNLNSEFTTESQRHLNYNEPMKESPTAFVNAESFAELMKQSPSMINYMTESHNFNEMIKKSPENNSVSPPVEMQQSDVPSIVDGKCVNINRDKNNP